MGEVRRLVGELRAEIQEQEARTWDQTAIARRLAALEDALPDSIKPSTGYGARKRWGQRRTEPKRTGRPYATCLASAIVGRLSGASRPSPVSTNPILGDRPLAAEGRLRGTRGRSHPRVPARMAICPGPGTRIPLPRSQFLQTILRPGKRLLRTCLSTPPSSTIVTAWPLAIADGARHHRMVGRERTSPLARRPANTGYGEGHTRLHSVASRCCLAQSRRAEGRAQKQTRAAPHATKGRGCCRRYTPRCR